MPNVTKILSALKANDPGAAQQLLPLVYDELRKLAAARLAQEKPGQTLQPTGLVHEAYLRLVEANDRDDWHSRGHFFAAAAEAMRRILVENARRKQRVKHGGDLQRVELPASDLEAPIEDVNIVALSDALDTLAATDPRQAELVKLRFFAGLTAHEAAQVLAISDSTADADWAYAKAFLRLEMSDEFRDRRV